jgi:hypothetical protein
MPCCYYPSLRPEFRMNALTPQLATACSASKMNSSRRLGSTTLPALAERALGVCLITLFHSKLR